MWCKNWCPVFVLVAVARHCVSQEKEYDEDEFEAGASGPTTPRPPPPVALQNMTDLVKSYGYDVEDFEVKVSDGQTIALYHLKPKTTDGPVVLLHHGLGMSPDVFCFQPDSLGFLLAGKGADVWMTSARGTVYSRKHAKYDPNNDFEFWDFSFVEMAEMDLPAVIDFVLEKSKQTSLFYVGHSLGTTILLVTLAKKPEYNSKIKEAILLAPMWHCTKFQGMINKQSPMYQMVIDTNKQFDDNKKWEAFPRKDVVKTDHQLRCQDLPEMVTSYCEMAMDMVYSSVGEFVPAGTSVKVFKHVQQSYMDGMVKPFDYEDEALNKKAYDQSTPPDYDIKKVTAKVNLFWAQADQLIDSEDVKKLSSSLPNVGISEQVEDESFGHPDFILPSTDKMKTATHNFHLKLVDMIK
ncbi:lipase 3-like [Nesidiocoris tenuis]|uniref:Lipase n=1 Tax=Nesidiocoris tenuis TaxID=355587 RepID=A0ABN7AFI4_9HEMI|nr:lipase 3-like [Nesidiocoris tenuis]